MKQRYHYNVANIHRTTREQRKRRRFVHLEHFVFHRSLALIMDAGTVSARKSELIRAVSPQVDSRAMGRRLLHHRSLWFRQRRPYGHVQGLDVHATVVQGQRLVSAQVDQQMEGGLLRHRHGHPRQSMGRRCHATPVSSTSASSSISCTRAGHSPPWNCGYRISCAPPATIALSSPSRRCPGDETQETLRTSAFPSTIKEKWARICASAPSPLVAVS